jgi:phosphonopyruvate decarboxylase
MSNGMPLIDALEVLHAARGEAVVIPSMGAAREWAARFEPHPLDFIHVPSSMGHTPGWGLGLALAQPGRRVIVCGGDGSLLMNLGCLVTTAAAAPANLTLLVLDNAAYEVTGGQPTPAALLGRGAVDFGALARESGLRAVHEFRSLAAWSTEADRVLFECGPVCVVLRVESDPAAGPVGPLPPARERVRAVADALSGRR